MTSYPQPIPRKTAAWGIALFVVSLGVLFGSSMLCYLVIRLQHTAARPLGSLTLPHSLWISTVVIVLSSFTIGKALAAVKLERQARLRRWLLWTAALAAVFVALQTPAMIHLLQRHQAEPAITPSPDAALAFPKFAGSQNGLMEQGFSAPQAPLGNGLYGFLFGLILLHALHVIGGLIFLAIVIRGAYRVRYDHEHYVGVRNLTVYWHFLDIVWLFMFFSLLAIG